MSVQMPQQEMVDIHALKLAEYNPRRISEEEMTKLVNSLKEFGFIQPVIARREDNLVIGGHQRIAAYQKVLTDTGGDTKVPVVFLDSISDERVKILNLALNRISGEWDFEKLALIFEEFNGKDLSMGEISLSGFDDKEIKSLLGSFDKEDYNTNSELNVEEMADGLKQCCPKCGFKFNEL
jgi:ParB-like chromosome segregation protein Spo0J